MRMIPLLFRIFLVALIVGVGFTILQAQENPDELKGRIEEIDHKLGIIAKQQEELRIQLEEGPKEEDLKRALERKLEDLRLTRDSLIRERERLVGKLESFAEPRREEPPPRELPERKSLWGPFKEPAVIAAAIGAIGIIVAALIGLLRRK